MRRKKIGKRKALIFVVLFVVFISAGCASGAPPDEAWNKTFGGTHTDWAGSVKQTADGGFIVAGYTYSYGVGSSDFWLVKTDANGTEQWNRTFGGTDRDEAYSVLQTSDGGYILAGTTGSYGAGSCDAWLIKTDANGTEQWNQTFGGTGGAEANSVQQTSDGGYVLAGRTDLYGAGSADFWLVKTGFDGNEQWNQTFGGTSGDSANSVQQTGDGGYILAGSTRSYGAGYSDFWLVKTESDGNEQWNQTFGGTGGDEANSVQQTADGGFIIAGYTDSYGVGAFDFWLVKTDSDGNKQWDKTFGCTDSDKAHSVRQTADGGYILVGSTYSYGAGLYDFWLMKTDSNGNKQWDKTLGGTRSDEAYSVQQTADGGYILAGYTYSYGAGSGDACDFWLIKVEREGPTPTTFFTYTPRYPGVNQTIQFDSSLSYDPDGNITNYEWDFGDGNSTNTSEKIITHFYTSEGDYNVNLTVTDNDGILNSTSKVVRVLKSPPPEEQWNKTFGGTDEDVANAVQQTVDGGYILVGSTESYGAGSADFWLVKTDSNGNKQWNRTFGGTDAEEARSVQQTTDGGYILVGSTESYGAGSADFWLLKTDSNGNEQWNQTFGGTGFDYAHSVQQTSDGGYVLAGRTDLYGAGSWDFWLVKTDSNGTEQWNKTFGGTDHDGARSVQQTADGCYILVGYTYSYGAGSFDFWLVKTDLDGNLQWNQTFGDTGDDYAYSVRQTADGGYILVGYTYSYGAGSYDFWLVKTDSDGNMQWNQTFGDTGDDYAYSVRQTADGGYILAGRTRSYGAGSYDFWLVKTDSDGNMQWDKTLGGPDGDEAYAVQQTSDGGYILAGCTYSYGASSGDAWLIKLKGEPTTLIFDTEPSENPYPSIMGTHNGTIIPSHNLSVSKLYTYACAGTGGHTESIELYDNGIPIANGTWNGYQGDWHNVTIHNLTGEAPYVTLLKNHKYNYTIRTGSYPQIIHETSFNATGGIITCTEFTEANGVVHYDGIPAIKLG